MSSTTSPRPRVRASEVCERFEASSDGLSLLTEDLDAEAYVEALLGKELFTDAASFVAHWLPKREAVHWACKATRGSLGEKPPRAELTALEAAERWVRMLDEPSRRAAGAAAEALKHRTAAALAAAAAGWTGGSLSSPELPVVPPPEFLPAKGAASSVLLAGTAPGAPGVPERLRELVRLGVEIANGKHRPGSAP